MSNLVMQFFKIISEESGRPEYRIARTIYVLSREQLALSMDEMYRLAERREALDTDVPFLDAELDDALRYLLQYGYLSSSCYELPAEEATEVLLGCPKEVFRYLILATAYENQGRYAAEPIPCPDDVLAWMKEKSMG